MHVLIELLFVTCPRSANRSCLRRRAARLSALQCQDSVWRAFGRTVAFYFIPDRTRGSLQYKNAQLTCKELCSLRNSAYFSFLSIITLASYSSFPAEWKIR